MGKKKNKQIQQQKDEPNNSNRVEEEIDDEQEDPNKPTPPSLVSLLLMKENRTTFLVLVVMTIAMFTLPFLAFYRAYHSYTLPADQFFYAGAHALGTVVFLMVVMIGIALVDSFVVDTEPNASASLRKKKD
jgi:hypothetical protein